MLRNRKFNLYISMMSLWLLILSAPVFAYYNGPQYSGQELSKK